MTASKVRLGDGAEAGGGVESEFVDKDRGDVRSGDSEHGVGQHFERLAGDLSTEEFSDLHEVEDLPHVLHIVVHPVDDLDGEGSNSVDLDMSDSDLSKIDVQVSTNTVLVYRFGEFEDVVCDVVRSRTSVFTVELHAEVVFRTSRVVTGLMEC